LIDDAVWLQYLGQERFDALVDVNLRHPNPNMDDYPPDDDRDYDLAFNAAWGRREAEQDKLWTSWGFRAEVCAGCGAAAAGACESWTPGDQISDAVCSKVHLHRTLSFCKGCSLNLEHFIVRLILGPETAARVLEVLEHHNPIVEDGGGDDDVVRRTEAWSAVVEAHIRAVQQAHADALSERE
jgi:hypothetical protein